MNVDSTASLTDILVQCSVCKCNALRKQPDHDDMTMTFLLKTPNQIKIPVVQSTVTGK